MNRRVAAKLSSIAFCLLVVASVLLAAAVLAFVSLSAYGTQQAMPCAQRQRPSSVRTG